MNWFYESGGQQNGPVNDEELDRLLAQGTITPETLIWREGQADWQPLRQARPSTPAGEGLVQCASCGQFKPADEIVQIGQRPICASCKPAVLLGIQQGVAVPGLALVERNGPAWEHRDTLGFFPALFETIKTVLTQPSETFTAMKREGGLASPLLYFLITGGAGMAVYFLFQILRFRFLPQSAGGIPNLQDILPIFTSVPAMLACLIIGPLFAVATVFINSGLLHVSLMICGGAKQPFETTFRCYCYAYGSGLALYVIPVCGMMAGGIWGLICAIIGLARAHEIHAGRAVLAVFLPLIVCCLIAFVCFFFIGIAASSSHH